MRCVTSVSASRSPTGSIRNSGVPASTCTLRATKTSRTRPLTGARMAISIFIASTTARRVPTSTTSSGATSTPTTSAAAGSSDDAGVVTGEAVGDAVDLDQVVAALGRGHDVEAALADREAAPASPQPFDVDHRHHAVELDLVAGQPDAAGPRPGTTARRAAARPRDRSRCSSWGRPRLAQPRNAARSRAAWSSLASRAAATRATSASRVGRCSSAAVSRSSHAVSTRRREPPARPRRSRRNDLLVVPPSHRARWSAQRPVQPGERLVTVAAVGDDLGDHRVVLGRDHVTLGHAGVDPDPRPDGEGQGLDGARGRRERALGVLGVEPSLDGVPGGRRRIPFQPATAGDVDLQLDQVEPGRQLGDRVLHLEPGVHLEERELPLGRLEEELDRPGVLVSGGDGKTDGGGPQFAILVGRRARCTGTPRSPSGCAAACCSRGRPPPTPCRACRR